MNESCLANTKFIRFEDSDFKNLEGPYKEQDSGAPLWHVTPTEFRAQNDRLTINSKHWRPKYKV